MTGQDFRARRLALGQSQFRIAVRLGVSLNTVRRWESQGGRVELRPYVDLLVQSLEQQQQEEASHA